MTMSTPKWNEVKTIKFSYEHWREGFLRIILYVTAGIGLLGLLYYVLTSNTPLFKGLAIGFYIILLLFTFLRMPYRLRAGFFLLLLYAISVSTLLDVGDSGASLFFLGFICIASLIISTRTGWYAIVISLATYAIIGWLVLTNRYTLMNGSASASLLSSWIKSGIYLSLLAVIIVNALNLIQREFIDAEERADSIFAELREERTHLEERVAERTSELKQRTAELEKASLRDARRTDQLEAIAQVSRAISSVRNLDILLPHIVSLVSQHFGFYHVGIFLNDEADQYAILAAANSVGGKRMLERGHRLQIRQKGIVGYVTGTGKARIALDTGADDVFFNNPDLPNTRSEMALPLRAGEQIIGALDVQSTEPAAFITEDIESLSILAEQVSIAIENSRLFQSARKSLDETETMYKQYLQREWGGAKDEQALTGFRYTMTGVAPFESLFDQSEISKAMSAGQIYQKNAQIESESAILAAPVQLRGQTIGILNITTPGGQNWTQDQIDLVKAVADRVALSVENARLLDETSSRAARERTVSEITTRIRSTNDPEIMLQTTLEELKRVLGASEIQIRPYTTADQPVEQPVAKRKRTTKPVE
jgi:GAF domain-containing protein